MDINHAPEFALLALYAEDMHRDSDTGAKLRAPDPDPRLVKDYNLKAYLIANDSIFTLGARMQVSPQALFYGYVAQSKGDETSWVVGVRGTAGIVEWIIDGQFLPDVGPRGPNISVEHGFWSIYETMVLTELNGITVIDPDAAAGIAQLIGPDARITVVGHSLGSALATYLAYDLDAHVGNRVSACLFASPRTGNKAWAEAVQAALEDRFLVVNYILDLVPQLPTGPDYCTMQNAVVVKPSTAEAGIKVEVRSNHHILCYAAMLSFAVFKANEDALQAVDAEERNCILGDSTTVPLEAKILERAIEAAEDAGIGTGNVLRTIIKFGPAPSFVV